MSIFSNVTQQDLINLRKLAQQEKEQRAEKSKNRNRKQTHNIKLAESLSPITIKLDESTEHITEVINPSKSEKENNQEKVPVKKNLEDSEDENIDKKIGVKALPISFRFSNLRKNTIGKLMSSKNSLKFDQDEKTGGASINGHPVLILSGNSWKIGDNVYELTPETHKALSSTGYTSKNMKNENDILMMNNILRDLGYTGIGDKKSNRKTMFTTTLPNLVEDIQNKTSDDLQVQGLKIIIPSKIIDIYTTLETILGLKISGHTDTLTEASKLIDELYKMHELQNKQQYRKAPNKFRKQ